MFDIISKADYWSYMDQGFVKPSPRRLKNAQDGYVLDRMKDITGARVLEIGGGDSRVLDVISAQGNECWNADDFAGSGNGPTELPGESDIRVVQALVGDFSPDLPDGYFDYVFSISVIEHVETDDLAALFADSCRLLKPGGTLFHAIDLYVFDDAEKQSDGVRARNQIYLDVADNYPLEWVEPPAVDATVTYRTSYASNSDEQLYRWSLRIPELRDLRANAQNVSIKCELRRTDD